MLTPIDIQNREIKSKMGGYDKKDVDDFLEEIRGSYEELYKENQSLKEKISSLSEGIQYYKKMESTLQKALVLAEKTSTETQEAAKALFSTGAAADMPKTELTEADLTDGNIDIMTLLVKCGLTASKSEARRAVQQGGVSVDGEKITDIAHTFAGEDFGGEGIVLKKGKKNFRKVIVK